MEKLLLLTAGQTVEHFGDSSWSSKSLRPSVTLIPSEGVLTFSSQEGRQKIFMSPWLVVS